jgi:hypothetical protein
VGDKVPWTFSASSDVIAEADLDMFADSTGPFRVHLAEDLSVKSAPFDIQCASPAPSSTPKPSATATPAPTETTAPSASASPTSSAAPSATSLPAPPTTGQGSDGGPSFGIVLLAIVLGTALTGGVTLIRSRGRQ